MDRPIQVTEFKAAHVPERLAGADLVEIRITLTPRDWRNWTDPRENMDLRPSSDPYRQTAAVIHVSRLEARDQRALASVCREMLENLLSEYMGFRGGL